MEGTAPIFTLLVASVIAGAFGIFVWGSLRDRMTAMHLNEELNEETLEAEAQDLAEWDAEASAWMRGLARKARRQVPCFRRPRRRRYGNMKPRARGTCGKAPRNVKPTLKSILTAAAKAEPVMQQKSLPPDVLERRLKAARKRIHA